MNVEENLCRRRPGPAREDIYSQDGVQKPKPNVSSETLPEQKHTFFSQNQSIPREECIVGKISFSNVYADRNKGIPFMHLSHDANTSDAVHLIMTDWQLPVPRIALVLVSNIRPLTGWKDLGLLKAFIKGIIKAANTTEMWIITHGINIGIVKMIGDAFNNEFIHQQNLHCHTHPAHEITLPQMTLLGICREDLLSHADKLNGEEFSVSLENEGNCPEENKFDLNPYHSHLIVVQDYTIRKAEINSFLLRFEKYISKKERYEETDISKNKEAAVPVIAEVPVIAVLVQGGVSCARLVLSHLQQQLPVVVVKGSGGLADLLAFTFYEVNRRPQRINDAEYIENILKPALSNKISHVFPYLRDNRMSRNLFCKNILECIKHSKQDKTQYLTVLNIHDQNCDLKELRVHLLKALLKSQKTDAENWKLQMQKDLLLTVDWNCPDVAVTEIFQEDSSRNLKVDNKIFEKALLKSGREEFVSIFLEQGFLVHKFLNAVTLGHLFRKSQQKEFFHTVCWEGILGYGQAMDITRQFIDLDLNWLIEELTNMPSYINSHQLDCNSAGIYGIGCQYKHDNEVNARSAELRAFTILIMWALLSNRGALAKILWKHSDQPMNTALICSVLLQNLLPYIHDSIQKTEVENLSEDFAEMATGVLNASYTDIPCRAYDAICEGLPEWGNQTSLEIASLAKNKTFLSHICCQKYLNNMFMGNIRIRELTWGFFSIPEFLKILFCAFLIFPMYIWTRFKISVHGEEIKDFGAYEIAEQETAPNELVFQSKRSSDSSFTVDDDMTEPVILLPTKAKIVYPPLRLMISWMWGAPITKFWVSQVFYMLFLALFSLDVLWPSCGCKGLDIAVFVWGLLIVLEDIHRVYILNKKYVRMPLFVKCIEIMYVLVFLFLGMTGRIFGYGIFADPYNSKVLLCLGLLYMYYRMIFIFLPISSTLGPLLFGTKRLVWFDFMNFMRMTLLVMISNGIILQASIYPDYPITPELFRQTLHRAWISLFITPIEDFTKLPDCVRWFRRPLNSTFCRASVYMDFTCPNPGFWPYVFGIQYLIILKLILLTLVAAWFSYTHSLLLTSSNAIWRYQRYQLVVDFSHRNRLPPPLNAISFMIIAFQAIKNICQYFRRSARKRKNSQSESNAKTSSSFSDYSYWKNLAQEYTKQMERNGEEENIRKQINDIISSLSDDVIHQRKLIHKIKSRTTELDFAVSNIHTYLETIRYRSARDEGQKSTVHVLSRRSPYLKMKIHRYPVPDKYVAWEVLLLNYDPPAYSMKRLFFAESMKIFVDEDVIAMVEAGVAVSKLPVFKWNMAVLNSEGVYENRQSWITDSYGELITYKLDSEGLPQNPMGRTGMKGRGALACWGPNHFIYVIITRWKMLASSNPTDQLEFIEMWSSRRNVISLPGGFVKEENCYTTLREFFKKHPNNRSWEDSSDMIDFFRSCVASTHVASDENPLGEQMIFQMILRGYMDDPANTDQAWKEVELWHFHFQARDILREKMKSKMGWHLVVEDVFTQLPPEQAILLQDTINTMKATVK